MKCVLLAIVLCATYANCFFFPSIKTVDNLELPRYLGRWYEVGDHTQKVLTMYMYQNT